MPCFLLSLESGSILWGEWPGSVRIYLSLFLLMVILHGELYGCLCVKFLGGGVEGDNGGG